MCFSTRRHNLAWTASESSRKGTAERQQAPVQGQLGAALDSVPSALVRSARWQRGCVPLSRLLCKGRQLPPQIAALSFWPRLVWQVTKVGSGPREPGWDMRVHPGYTGRAA